MSETKLETKEKQPETTTLVEDTLSAAQSKNIILQKLVDELTVKLNTATDELEQLKNVQRSRVKAQLIADIEGRYTEPKELLILKSVDELKQIKHVLDRSPPTSFMSGTRVVSDKTSPRAKLDNKFAEAQAKRAGGNK